MGILDKIPLIPHDQMTPEYNHQLSPEARKKAVRAYQEKKLRLYHKSDEKPANPRGVTKPPSAGKSIFITFVLVAILIAIIFAADSVGIL